MIHEPFAGATPRTPRSTSLLFIDALNVAYWCGNPPSLRVPMTLLAHRLELQQPAILYFDASAPHRLAKDEADLYAQLRQSSGHVVEVPSGVPADRVLLQHARSAGACILSRDKFGDHRRRFRKLIDDPTRMFTGYVRDNRVQVPVCALDIPLAVTADAAWVQLQRLIARAGDALDDGTG